MGIMCLFSVMVVLVIVGVWIVMVVRWRVLGLGLG